MINITNLKIVYKETNKVVFSNLNISVIPGEIVALVGPSGCGKTTLLNHIGGLLDENDVEIRGEIIRRENRDIKYVFQDPLLLPWKNVYDNIIIGLEIKSGVNQINKEKVMSIIKMVSLGGFESYYPYQLSRGMAQRVNFARAIVCEPGLILLDEPFSSLDYGIKKKIQKDFLEIIKREKITTIFVTHDLEEARRMADRVMVFQSKEGNSLLEIEKDKYSTLESFFEL